MSKYYYSTSGLASLRAAGSTPSSGMGVGCDLPIPLASALFFSLAAMSLRA